MDPKAIAFYLPQFHQVPENDEWWGEGFTEWTNVRKASPLYKGHRQPRQPAEQNYYDLLRPDTLRWQADLAKKFNVFGFCFYHYWFNGRKILEKPAELLLSNPDIPLNFCFSWANEPWTRSWDGKNKQVLLSQSYGDELAWKEHYNYLSKFFLDDRYIKLDGKPILAIYRTESIPNCEKMISTWEKMAKEDGLPGLCILETVNSFQNRPALEGSTGVIEFEPMYTLRHHMGIANNSRRLAKKLLGPVDSVDYDSVWRSILAKRPTFKNKTTCSGAFVDWDNTPRKGRKGLVVNGGTPEKFGRYLKEKINSSTGPFIFINAWNEWAEGAYLEPDSHYRLAYLDALQNATKELQNNNS